MASFVLHTQSTLPTPMIPTSAAHRRVFFSRSLPSLRTQFRRPLQTPKLRLFSPIRIKPSKSIVSSSLSTPSIKPAIEQPVSANPPHDWLSGSTRTVTTLVAVALTASKFLARGLFTLAVQLKEPLLSSARPAFFAAATQGNPSTPFTLVAVGMSKWLDLYGGILLIRVLLSWFPNIPWERQPMLAIRDLCDPYLSLFRNIVPPVLGILDVSPIFAFTVLGVLSGILKVDSPQVDV
ncbi:YGGT family protein [Striga hermonthica]|uniref:YGGT family protein n=1 Tax=Striga hermonthica TaxID=68872 RepID=A0A9N7NXD7_STRHE|nr:YGGT family protein [Striga hermonthica]